MRTMGQALVERGEIAGGFAIQADALPWVDYLADLDGARQAAGALDRALAEVAAVLGNGDGPARMALRRQAAVAQAIDGARAQVAAIQRALADARKG